jgi:hypothetical protein
VLEAFVKDRETLEREKTWAWKVFGVLARSVRPWVDRDDIIRWNRRHPETPALQVPVVLPNIGFIGHVIPGYGFAPLIAGGAITSYNDIINARANGKAEDVGIVKASYTTVANVWSCGFRSGGFPPAGSYANIPGGSVLNRASTGAWPLTNPATGERKYLLTLGTNHGVGTNIVLLVDLLVAAGGINANVAGAQTVNTVALTRYAGAAAAGNMIILEVTTALGTTGSNFTATYTNHAGVSGQTTAALAMTTSAIVQRLQPVGTTGWLIPLVTGDLGVRSVETVSFSAAMGAGVVALLIFRPLLFLPTIATTTYVERDSTLQVDGLTELVVGSDGELGCLAEFLLTSTTSTGARTYFYRTVSG